MHEAFPTQCQAPFEGNGVAKAWPAGALELHIGLACWRLRASHLHIYNHMFFLFGLLLT